MKVPANLGWGGAELDALWRLLNELVDDLAALQNLANDLKAKYNAQVALVNELKADFNALLAKLDADAGVTDTNYAATRSVAAQNAAATAVADVALKTARADNYSG